MPTAETAAMMIRERMLMAASVDLCRSSNPARLISWPCSLIASSVFKSNEANNKALMSLKTAMKIVVGLT